MDDRNLTEQNLVPQPPLLSQNPLVNYQFSAEELQALRECNIDSFFQRSLPLGTGLGLAAYYGVKRGFFIANQRFGAAPKVIVGAIIGYFFGKMSYQTKCTEKLMRIPGSRLGEILREQKRGSVYNTFSRDQPGLALAPFNTPNPDIYSDETIRRDRSTSLNLDTERPIESGLDDIHRPTVDSPITVYEDNLPLDPPKHTVTYDELRKQNREDYLKKSQNPYNRALPAEAPVIVRTEKERPPPDADATSRQKNRYGDIWSQ